MIYNRLEVRSIFSGEIAAESAAIFRRRYREYLQREWQKAAAQHRVDTLNRELQRGIYG